MTYLQSETTAPETELLVSAPESALPKKSPLDFLSPTWAAVRDPPDVSLRPSWRSSRPELRKTRACWRSWFIVSEIVYSSMFTFYPQSVFPGTQREVNDLCSCWKVKCWKRLDLRWRKWCSVEGSYQKPLAVMLHGKLFSQQSFNVGLSILQSSLYIQSSAECEDAECPLQFAIYCIHRDLTWLLSWWSSNSWVGYRKYVNCDTGMVVTFSYKVWQPSPPLSAIVWLAVLA